MVNKGKQGSSCLTRQDGRLDVGLDFMGLFHAWV